MSCCVVAFAFPMVGLAPILPASRRCAITRCSLHHPFPIVSLADFLPRWRAIARVSVWLRGRAREGGLAGLAPSKRPCRSLRVPARGCAHAVRDAPSLQREGLSLMITSFPIRPGLTVFIVDGRVRQSSPWSGHPPRRGRQHRSRLAVEPTHSERLARQSKRRAP